jgi:muramoyltetrapeptide carboxypeptidase
LGTPFAPQFDGRVLYLEEVNEAPYRIDRMLQQIKLAGHFGHIRGVIFGDATGDEDHEDSKVRAILSEWGEAVGLPVWWGFPSSHRSPTLAVPLGVMCTIDANGRVSLAGSAAAQHG